MKKLFVSALFFVAPFKSIAAGQQDGFVVTLPYDVYMSEHRIPAGRYAFEIDSQADCKILATSVVNKKLIARVAPTDAFCRAIAASKATETFVETYSEDRAVVVWFETYNSKKKTTLTVILRFRR
jgi:hypothetical protein